MSKSTNDSTEVRRLKKPDGTIVYLLGNKLHNWEDAAVINPNGKKEYWLFGFEYSKDEFLDRKRDSNGIPPAKNPKYDSTF